MLKRLDAHSVILRASWTCSSKLKWHQVKLNKIKYEGKKLYFSSESLWYLQCLKFFKVMKLKSRRNKTWSNQSQNIVRIACVSGLDLFQLITQWQLTSSMVFIYYNKGDPKLIVIFNPLPYMPNLGSCNSAANKDMMLKILTNGDTNFWLSRKDCGKRRNCSLRAISSFSHNVFKSCLCWRVKLSIYGVKG